MAMTLHVDIVSAEKELFSGTAEMVTAPGEMGELGILPRHSQLLTRLKPGQVRVRLLGGEEQLFYVSGGMLEVQPHLVTILSDTAERARDLDEAAARPPSSAPNRLSPITGASSNTPEPRRNWPRPLLSCRRSRECADCINPANPD